MKLVYYILELLLPRPDYMKSITAERHDAVGELIKAIRTLEATKANIRYLEERIERIDTIIKTGNIPYSGDSGNPISLSGEQPRLEDKTALTV